MGTLANILVQEGSPQAQSAWGFFLGVGGVGVWAMVAVLSRYCNHSQKENQKKKKKSPGKVVDPIGCAESFLNTLPWSISNFTALLYIFCFRTLMDKVDVKKYWELSTEQAQ